MAQGHKVWLKKDWLWVRSPFEEVKYLFECTCSFLRSGVDAKCGVDFRHSTCNSSTIRHRMLGSECLNIRFALITLLCADTGYSVKWIYFFLKFILNTFIILLFSLHKSYIFLFWKKIFMQNSVQARRASFI